MNEQNIKVSNTGFDAFIPPEMAARAENIGVQKADMGWKNKLALGILAGAFIFPISAFVAAGFEHSVANMYFIPMGLFIKLGASEAFWSVVGKTAGDYSSLTCYNFLIADLLPVTIGNIIGGAGMVGLVYWFIYLRKKLVPKFE